MTLLIAGVLHALSLLGQERPVKAADMHYALRLHYACTTRAPSLTASPPTPFAITRTYRERSIRRAQPRGLP